MKKIAFDVMGNDNGVESAVLAVKEFTKNNKMYSFILVGDKSEINKYIVVNDFITILDVKKSVSKKNGLADVRKQDSSMFKALELVKNKEADIVMSSGDSAIYLGMATLVLKRQKEIKRSAFMSIFPTINPKKKYLMLDIGANLSVTGEMLYQWAKIANTFSIKVLKVENPKVGIVNIGTEEYKGQDFHKDAYKLLESDKKINFQGYVEPRQLMFEKMDVAVIDGYAGNIALKTMEGSILAILKSLKTSLKSKTKYKIGALLAKGAFHQVKDNLDYRNVGSAWIIGLQSLAIKCHGGADKKSYLGALNQIKKAFDNGVKETIRGGDNG